MNRRIGRLGCLFAPGYGCCFRCGTPWKFVREHSTEYRSGSGCFPLCEKCWRGLGTPEARLPFYRQLWEMWKSKGSPKSEETWQQIEAAVRSGA